MWETANHLLMFVVGPAFICWLTIRYWISRTRAVSLIENQGGTVQQMKFHTVTGRKTRWPLIWHIYYASPSGEVFVADIEASQGRMIRDESLEARVEREAAAFEGIYLMGIHDFAREALSHTDTARKYLTGVVSTLKKSQTPFVFFEEAPMPNFEGIPATFAAVVQRLNLIAISHPGFRIESTRLTVDGKNLNFAWELTGEKPRRRLKLTLTIP